MTVTNYVELYQKVMKGKNHSLEDGRRMGWGGGEMYNGQLFDTYKNWNLVIKIQYKIHKCTPVNERNSWNSWNSDAAPP